MRRRARGQNNLNRAAVPLRVPRCMVSFSGASLRWALLRRGAFSVECPTLTAPKLARSFFFLSRLPVLVVVILELLQFFRWFVVHLAENGKTATRSVRDC